MTRFFYIQILFLTYKKQLGSLQKEMLNHSQNSKKEFMMLCIYMSTIYMYS